MRKFMPSGHCRLAFQLAAAGTLATLMSGCSSDVTRLTDPFSNPFSSASNEEAPVAAPRHVASAGDVIPAGRTPPVSSQALAPRSASVAYNSSVSRETTGSIDPGPTRFASGPAFGNWTTTGGTPIQVAEGENADVLAKRYGVPTTALLQVNGLRSAGEVRPGAHLTIPVYSSSSPRAQPVFQASNRQEEHRAPAAGRERIMTASAEPVRASGPAGRWVAGAAPAPTTTAAPRRPMIAQRTEAHVDPHKRIDGKAAPATVKAAPVEKIATAKPLPAAQPLAAVVPGSRATVKSAALASARPQAIAAAEAPKVAVEPSPAAMAPPAGTSTVASADGNPEFRWPARGRIIQSFKGGSGGNDGINIAVPEGTSVRAAEGGVVAYAGSELKGYGNLVLIRHPNGFVSAYANNGQIDVKRGETVKRGQEIAKSGQSGNVSSPQLHFELRKGSTPVDPTQYLAGL